MSILRVIKEVEGSIISAIAEYGMIDEVPEDFINLVSEEHITILKEAVLCPAQGWDNLLESIEEVIDYETAEEFDLPEEENVIGLINKFKELYQRKRNIETLTRSLEDFESGDPQKEQMALERLTSVQPSMGNVLEANIAAMPYDGDIEDIVPDRSTHLETGTIFDSWCRLGIGEIGVIMGQPSVGKSHALIDIGAGYIENNEGLVIHFSEEMGTGSVVGRYNRRIAGKSKRPTRVWNALPGKLVVESHATNTATVPFLEERVKKLQKKYGEGLDITCIIIDYASLLRCPRTYGRKDEEISDIITSCRALGFKLNTRVWTAHQPQRGPSKDVSDTRISQLHEAPVLTMHDVGECWGVAQVVDYLVTLNQTKDERGEEHPICRLHRAKVREEESDVIKETTIKCNIDYSRSSFM